jgi:hypothetical protein
MSESIPVLVKLLIAIILGFSVIPLMLAFWVGIISDSYFRSKNRNLIKNDNAKEE